MVDEFSVSPATRMEVLRAHRAILVKQGAAPDVLKLVDQAIDDAEWEHVRQSLQEMARESEREWWRRSPRWAHELMRLARATTDIPVLNRLSDVLYFWLRRRYNAPRVHTCVMRKSNE
jgi:hypothetical protein